MSLQNHTPAPCARFTLRHQSLLRLSATAMAVAASSFLALAQAPQTTPPTAPDARFEKLHVAGNVYLFAGTGAHVVVQAGDDGVVFVDTSSAAVSARLLREAQAISARPIRYVINTSADADHVGGNENISSAGRNFATPAPNTTGVRGSFLAERTATGGAPIAAGQVANNGRTPGAQVYAHEAALNRLTGQGGAPAAPFGLWPTDTFFTLKKTLYFNGEPIELLHQPSAHTDGDVMVWFRKSDVVAAGDIYTPDRYPMIDLARGGSVQGFLDALNRIIDITVPRFNQQGGTMVVGGHGRIGNESDVVEYRDMTTIIRDRVALMISEGKTLAQVRAANPLLDYDGTFGSKTGPWTSDMFLEAMYQDLSKTRK